MKKRVFSALTAALFVLVTLCAALPAQAGVEAQYTTPSGYNDHDYQKLVAFFEQTDAQGVKNGKKINSAYSPTDPSTWTDGFYGVNWETVGGKKRAHELMFGNYKVAGAFDVSGCTSIEYISCRSELLTSMNVSGCTGLAYLSCADCKLASLNASGCSSLYDVYCANNVLTGINLSGCTGLVSLDCMVNKLTTLDLSDCRMLNSLSCEDNRFKSIDLSHCPQISINSLRADGDGYVAMFGRTYSHDYCIACAEPMYDAPFLGWYTTSGVKISDDRELPENSTSYTDLVAKFGRPEYVPGDANNDLTVNTEDALLVLRAALGLIQFDNSTIMKCDMDYSGNIDTTDALLILRIALDLN